VPRQQHCCKVKYYKAINEQGTCLKIQKCIRGVGLKNQQLLIDGGTCLNIVFDQTACPKNKERVKRTR
jgi:hypothetical protein